MTPENKDVAGLLPSSELSDALNEFIPEWDDKAFEIRKLRAKIERITALAAPGAAIAAREQKTLSDDDLREAANDFGSFEGEDWTWHFAESSLFRLLREFAARAAHQEAPVASGEPTDAHSKFTRWYAQKFDRSADFREPMVRIQYEAFSAALASPSGAGLGGAVASSEAVEHEPMHASVVKRIWSECRAKGLDYVAFAWRIERAALASQPGCAVEEGAWLPTPANINAMPDPVRGYIHDLVANCDPAGMVRENAMLRDTNAGLQKMYRAAADALTEVRGCFEMAESEGLSMALSETTDEHLKDLVERRLMYAMHAALQANSTEMSEGAKHG